MGIVTIAGGQHFNDETLQEALNSGIDVVVLGEGEVTISELLAAFDSGKPLEEVKGIAFLQDGKIVNTGYRDPIVDFSSFPLPDFSCSPCENQPLPGRADQRVRYGMRVLYCQGKTQAVSS